MSGFIFAQDLHYSMFFNSPLNLNPALTGVFDGDQRLHANYKRQWFSVPVEYQSFDIGADMKFLSAKSKNYLSLGALINYDKAGDLNLQYTGFDLFGSYSIKVGKGYLTPGLNLGVGFRSYDTTNGLLGEQWDGSAVNTAFAPLDPLYLGQNSENLTFVDVNFGINYRHRKASRKYFDLGLSVNNLTAPSQVFNKVNNDDSDLIRKFNIYGMMNWKVLSKIDLLINALGSFQDPYQEIVLNAQGKLYLNDQLNRALYLGAGYRIDDAWYPMIALEIERIYAAFSYDFTISDFGKGDGPEFAVRYILAKLPVVPKKPCPIY